MASVNATASDRGVCPVCDRSIRLNKNATIRHHGTHAHRFGETGYRCDGSGQQPKN